MTTVHLAVMLNDVVQLRVSVLAIMWKLYVVEDTCPEARNLATRFYQRAGTSSHTAGTASFGEKGLVWCAFAFWNPSAAGLSPLALNPIASHAMQDTLRWIF